MLALYICCGVLALLALILLLPLSLVFRLEDGAFTARLRVFFWSVSLYPKKDKKQKAKPLKQKKDKGQKEGKNKKEPSTFQKMVEEKGFSGAVQEVCSLTGKLVGKAKDVLAHAKLYPFHIRVRVGGQDAAVTAIEYGSVCAVIYPLLGLLSSAVRIPDPKVTISADYSGVENELFLQGKLSCKVFWLLTALTMVLTQYIKEKAETNQKSQMNKGGVSS